jgi:hypothetical protein
MSLCHCYPDTGFGPQSVTDAIAVSAGDVLATHLFLLKFFLLVFAHTIPFWLIGAATGLELLPGLAVAALAAWCPMLAAMILIYRENKIGNTLTFSSQIVLDPIPVR